ncbi:MAG: TVP38/TMEM64 family protein [Desulfobulbaceae bacterium]|jgi:uncharacterized membrane protein YdjX (TVP38/TMEM64 family)|nr:TVP38/TMEM64 family protein [Desulfobulbaceae bacterium]
MKSKLTAYASSITGRIVLIILVALVLIVAFSMFDSKKHLIQFFAWLDSYGALAAPIFILVNMLIVVFILPSAFLTLGAGFMFGVVQGTVYILISTTSGALISFVIARYFFSDRISNYFLGHPRLQLLHEKFSGTGWRGILLTRLIPFFPFKLSNYFFGLSRFSLRDFGIGTFFGIIPFTLFNAYIGSLAADLATLGVRHTERSTGEWLLYGFGFILTIAALIGINRMAQKALLQSDPDKTSERPEQDPAAPGDAHTKSEER